MIMLARKEVQRPILTTEYSVVTVILNDENGQPLARTQQMLVTYETGGFGDAMEKLGYPLSDPDFDIVRTILVAASPKAAVSER